MKADIPSTLSTEDILKLKDLLARFESFAEQNKDLTRRLGLRNKFVETIGEGLGLVMCYDRFGTSVFYEWPGRRGKGFDIALRSREGGRYIKIQVKTNTDAGYYTFKLPNVKVSKKVRDELKTGNTEGMMRLSDAQVDQTDTDFYLLVHKNETTETCYILDKDRLKEAIRGDYRVYFNRNDERRRRNIETGRYNFGIGKHSHIWWPHLNQKVRDSLTEYERDWNLISRKLNL